MIHGNDLCIIYKLIIIKKMETETGDYMRFCIDLDLNHKEINLDYRSCILSFIKNAFMKHDKRIYNSLYHDNDTIIKPFTYSVNLNNAEFMYKKIVLEHSNIKLNFSTSDAETGINFYNAMQGVRYKKYKFGDNSIRLKGINVIKEKRIVGNHIKIKTMSAVIIRKHHKISNHDIYYKIGDAGYLEVLKQNIYITLKDLFDFDIKNDLDNMKLSDINIKEVLILYHGHKIGGNVGNFTINAENYLIDCLVKTGFGSRKSQGFGMLEVLC